MRAYIFGAGFSLSVVLALGSTAAKPPEPQTLSPAAKEYLQKYESLPWVTAPEKPKIAERGSISLNPDVRFLGTKGSSDLLTLNGNLPEDNDYTIAPKRGFWFAIYSFKDIGYVKDDEKIDADALLKSMRDAQEQGNTERKDKGLEPLTVAGWAVPPHYDPATHNLEYGVLLDSPKSHGVNYHLRMLGRHGVMDADLISSPQTLDEDLAAFRAANKGFAYQADENYAAYKQGDKVSEYGLAALVTGGAFAVAAKTGLLGIILKGALVFWKFIAIGFVAFFAGIRRFFGGFFGRKDDRGNDYTPDYEPPAEG